MGFGIQELLIVLIIVALIFGTKKLKGMGSDLGGAVKGFKKALNDDSESEDIAMEDDKAQQEKSTATKKTAKKK